MRSMRLIGFASVWAVGFWVALTGVAWATVIPSASFYEIAEVITGGPPGTTVDACGSGNGCPGAGTVSEGSTALGASATGSVISTASTPLTVSGSVSSTGLTGTQGNGHAVYYFEWSGPSGAGPIPTFIDIIMNVAASGDPNDIWARAAANADFEVDNATGVTTINPTNAASTGIACYEGGYYVLNGNYNICGSNNFTSTLIYDLSPNVVYSVQLDALAITDGYNGLSPTHATTTMSASASVDPHIYLDPSYLNPGYQLLLSPGIDNEIGSPSTSVPEPASLVLLGSAITGLAMLRRRRSIEPAGRKGNPDMAVTGSEPGW